MTLNPPLHIRRGVPADADALIAFNTDMAAETEGLVLSPARITAGVQRVLADPALGFYVVAQRGAQAVGALLITLEWSDWRDGCFWWIQSVYVLPRYRGMGVYRRLYDFVQAEARNGGGVCGLRLYVEKHNTRAQEIYRHLGMAPSHYDMYEVALEP